MSDVRKDIRRRSKEELRSFFVQHGAPAFHGNQVYEWLWQKALTDFAQMTNLSKAHRALLSEHFNINHTDIAQVQKSDDGTMKNAVRLHDGKVVESVLIPTETRSTACVSSQVGCSLDCSFCATAQLKRMRNLNPDEIFDQVATLNRQSLEHFSRPLSNIVFMGMGEPMMNYPNVIKAIEKITSPEGMGMSPRRITVSTSGIPKMIVKMADEHPRFKLAVSLHSAVEETRNKIMPFSTNFPLVALKDSIQYWYSKTKERVTYEYVVWKNINDTADEVKALVRFCKHTPSKVNLIEYNPVGNNAFEQAHDDAIELYVSELSKHQIPVTIRRSRGKDIDAACGQLANKSTL
ncbi:MAG: 23S rRNA (adenine(2503)-C(2))-methyltransferase RlmN [Bacteroidetes bacterium]|nr:23S rRNA (adenine(2503)-C(2))-methyltransferase RlmN [Bacteroidota bacterium]MDA0888821.1 23S rRNA (adenine(2503)-C(2))-methyltransferase RlmN [Bacteroidota bacterium]MDA1084584.1 23S rRNA (adenine(2503)-C(2))-methyltransferase RlmN [Bacteroidota bacterium]